MKVADAAERRAILTRSPLFQALQPEEIDAILSRASVRRVGKGETILSRGDPGTGMLVILGGQVRVSVVSEEGKEVTLGVLGPGEVLGEMSLLDGEDCSADAAAIEDCVLLFVDRGQFFRLLRASSDMCLRLLSVLTRRLRRSNSALEDMALLDLPTRLGRLLLRLAHDYGCATPIGTRIEVKLSQKDLSTLVGGSREKVNRQLREWEDEGLLGKDAGRIVVRKPELLARAE